MFAEVLGTLRDRFPQIHFSKAQGGPDEAAIYVYDMDFYFSDRFNLFLDELVRKLPAERLSGLDFYPAEAPRRLASGSGAAVAATGVAEAAVQVDPVQPRTASVREPPTN